MRPPIPTHLLALALALALGLAACGADEAAERDRAELEVLREEVNVLVERDAVREERLADLEATAERLAQADPSSRITDAERELAQLVDTLTLLDEELAAAVTDTARRDAEVATTTDELAEQNTALQAANAQLRSTVDELGGQLEIARGRIDRVSGEVEDLGIRYETLRDRLDRVGR